MSGVLLEARDVTKDFGGLQAISEVSFNIRKGEIFSVIGPNGAGKTTLFRMLTGQEKPDSGTLKVGDTVKFAYVDQSRDSLNPDNVLWQEISDGSDVVELGKKSMPA
ncbi:MAG TPA: ATP-binding cassette domain-containing protein, partial [Syntrophales bacterium]